MWSFVFFHTVEASVRQKRVHFLTKHDVKTCPLKNENFLRIKGECPSSSWL